MKKPFETIDKYFNYRLPLIAVVSFIVVLIIWASVAEIDQQVRGTGRIIPSGKARAIQHLEGGIVKEILVREGEQVNEGQVLFTIGNQKNKSSLEEIYVDITALKIRKARLQAELEGKDDVVFDRELSEQYDQIVQSETQLFNARQSQFEEKINGLNERKKQKQLKLEDLRAQITNLKAESLIAIQQNDIKKKLRASGASSQSQYLGTQSQVQNFKTRIEQVQKEIPIIQAEYTEISNLIEETKQNVKSEILNDLNKVNIDLKKFEERVRGAEDQVDRTTIKSTVRGIINKININTIGGVIAPGQVVAEIIPLDEKLLVEGMISTADRGKIWPNLPVMIKVSAYDYSFYGGIPGVLSQISADSLIDSKGQEFYRVNIELKSNKLREDKVIYPGMMVDINILTSKVTVMHALLKPLLHTRDNALREQYN